MNTASEVLVIIVSIILSIFLIALVVLIVQVIRLVKEVRGMVERAEKVVTSAASISKIFRKTAGPVGLFNLAKSVMETVSEHKHKGEK